MNFDTGTIIELLNATSYRDVSALCQTDKRFRTVCQSELGMKIILSKLEQLPSDLLFQELLTLKYRIILKFCQLSNIINKVCANPQFCAKAPAPTWETENWTRFS